MTLANISINIPDTYNDVIESLIKKGIVTSRSEAVRIAIFDLLSKDLTFSENIKKTNH